MNIHYSVREYLLLLTFGFWFLVTNSITLVSMNYGDINIGYQIGYGFVSFFIVGFLLVPIIAIPDDRNNVPELTDPRQNTCFRNEHHYELITGGNIIFCTNCGDSRSVIK